MILSCVCGYRVVAMHIMANSVTMTVILLSIDFYSKSYIYTYIIVHKNLSRGMWSSI